MLGIDKKAIFPSQNVSLYNLFYLAALKTLNSSGGVILALSFLVNIISLPTIKGVLYFK